MHPHHRSFGGMGPHGEGRVRGLGREALASLPNI